MKLIITIFVVSVLVGCKLTSPTETDRKSVQEVADSLHYVKARNGLCFGVTLMERISTSGAYTENFLIVNVPCQAVGL